MLAQHCFLISHLGAKSRNPRIISSYKKKISQLLSRELCFSLLFTEIQGYSPTLTSTNWSNLAICKESWMGSLSLPVLQKEMIVYLKLLEIFLFHSHYWSSKKLYFSYIWEITVYIHKLKNQHGLIWQLLSVNYKCVA